MSEATDRPDAAAGISAPAPPVTESYKPLSLWALSGFGLAVLYSLVVVVGGLIALLNRMPWLMPGWSFFLPLAALLVCWAARARIQASENTLSGLAFTTWGFRLTIILGFTYAAYYGATYFVIRHQAVECVDRVFDALKKGQVEKSFLLGINVPIKDVPEDLLRDKLEVQYNASGGGPATQGPFTRYRQSELVRMIEYNGAEATIVPLGVVDWEYSKGGYRVVLRYHVACAMADFDVNVETFGRDSQPGEKGRQWHIPLDRGGLQVVSDTIRPTERGAENLQRGKTAQSFANAWIDKVNHQDWLNAYLDTLPPAERAPWAKGQNTARLLILAPLAGASVFGLCDADCRAILNLAPTRALQKLVQVDEKTFWTGKKQRAVILQRVERTLLPLPGLPDVSMRLATALPEIIEGKGQTTLKFDLVISYLNESRKQAEFVAEARLVVRADNRDVDRRAGWHVAALEMEAGRTPPPMPNRGQQPPPRGAGGPAGGQNP